MASSNPLKGRIKHLRGLVWRSLIAQRVRTALSAVSVALGAGTIVAAGVVRTGIQGVITTQEAVFGDFFDMILTITFTSVGIIISAAAAFLVFNAFAMSVTQRRQEIGAMRAVGMTRSQVLRQILSESLATGVLGAAVGLIAGPLFGAAMLAAMRQTGLNTGTGHVRFIDVLLAVIVSLVFAGLAAYLPARSAARVSPISAMRRQVSGIDGHGSLPRTVMGLVVAVALVAYLFAAPPGEWSGKHPPWEWIMTIGLWVVWLAAFGLLVPALVGGAVRLVRPILIGLGKTHGRLMADNLGRARQRVTITVVTFAIGLALIVGMVGLINFQNGMVKLNAARYRQGMSWIVYPFDSSQGLSQLNAMGGAGGHFKPEVIEDMEASTAGQALVTGTYMVVVPEISSPIPGFPSTLSGIEHLDYPGGFEFSRGGWETARPVMQSGCGLLITETVAGRLDVDVDDTTVVTGRDGPVTCTVGGVGTGGVLPLSLIGIAARDAFIAPDVLPDTLIVRPLEGADLDEIEADLETAAARHPGDAFIYSADESIEGVIKTSEQLLGMFGAMVLLAEVAAALGMINTTMMTVAERRHELGLLRAVGATRRQVMAIVTGEAALMGFVGAVFGVVLGVGIALIFGMSQGGYPFGFPGLDIRGATLEALGPALPNGLIGILAAPLLAAAAAYPVARAALRGTPIDTMGDRGGPRE